MPERRIRLRRRYLDWIQQDELVLSQGICHLRRLRNWKILGCSRSMEQLEQLEQQKQKGGSLKDRYLLYPLRTSWTFLILVWEEKKWLIKLVIILFFSLTNFELWLSNYFKFLENALNMHFYWFGSLFCNKEKLNAFLAASLTW